MCSFLLVAVLGRRRLMAPGALDELGRFPEREVADAPESPLSAVASTLSRARRRSRKGLLGPGLDPAYRGRSCLDVVDHAAHVLVDGPGDLDRVALAQRIQQAGVATN